MALFSASTVYFIFQSIYRQNLNKLTFELAKLMSEQQISIFLGRGNLVHVEDILTHMVRVTPVKYAYVIDQQGMIVTASDQSLPTNVKCCYPWEETAQQKLIDQEDRIYQLKVNSRDLPTFVP